MGLLISTAIRHSIPMPLSGWGSWEPKSGGAMKTSQSGGAKTRQSSGAKTRRSGGAMKTSQSGGANPELILSLS